MQKKESNETKQLISNKKKEKKILRKSICNIFGTYGKQTKPRRPLFNSHSMLVTRKNKKKNQTKE
jgi:hypothetical protein